MLQRLCLACAVIVTIGCGLVFADVSAGVQDSVLVGLARIDITPDYPVRLAGYASRMDEVSNVVDRLWGKAIAIGSNEGDGPAVLVVLDSCSATAGLATAVATRLKEKAGVRPERCVVASTHTHSAPLLPDFAGWHYTKVMPAEHAEHMNRYRRELVDQLTQVALDALAARKPARLAWAQGAVSFGVNRRRLENGKWVGFLPRDARESPGPVDPRLPVLRVTNLEGKLVGIVANYACHCTTVGASNEIHGDWAGFAQKAMEAAHPEAVALMLIGCGADVGPYPGSTLEHAQQYGRAVADEVDRLLQGEWKRIPASLVARQETIQVPLGQLPNREELQRRTQQGSLGARDMARHFLAILERDGALPKSFDYPITTWTFGDDLAMVFLPGEVVVDYSLRLKRELDSSRLWVTAYANGMPCYVASERMLDEGGYEVDSSMVSYGQPTRLAPETEDTVIRAVRSLVPPAFGRKK